MGEIIDLRAAAAEARAAYYSFVIELRERGICECAGGCERSATGADRIRLNELLRRWERLIPRDDLTF